MRLGGSGVRRKQWLQEPLRAFGPIVWNLLRLRNHLRLNALGKFFKVRLIPECDQCASRVRRVFVRGVKQSRVADKQIAGADANVDLVGPIAESGIGHLARFAECFAVRFEKRIVQ